jgi:hypothetical protein
VAEDVNSVFGADRPKPLGTPPVAPAAPAPSRAEQARKSAYRQRFVLVYYALAVILGCAIGALVVGIGSSDDKKPAPAAVFRPTTSGEVGAMDLAQRVQHTYRLASGDAFVDIVATRNTLQDGNLGFLRVRFQIIQPVDALKDRDALILSTNDAIQFSLCGAEASCAIPGTPTKARATLLRRQGLELALRTFANDQSVDSVAVFLRPVPPPEGSSAEGYVMVLNRGRLLRNDPTLLSKPVSAILPGVGKEITPADVTAKDTTRITELTKPYLFTYRYQLVGGRDAVLDLTPVNG